MTAVPSASQVAELGRSLHSAALPSFEDGNGHVNVVEHYRLHMDTADLGFIELGFSTDYRQQTGLSVFSVEHHIRYFAEITVGDMIGGYMRVLGRSNKAVHLMTFLVNETTGELANALESIEVSVDLNTRKSAPFDPSMAAIIDARLDRDLALGWQAPTAGTIGLR